MAQKVFPEWAKIVYRGVRAGVAAGIAAAFATQPDWSKPEEALRVVAVAFGTGCIIALAKWVRNYIDEQFGWDEKSLVAKIIPV